MISGILLRATFTVVALCALPVPSLAAASKASISGLSDVTFGTIGSFSDRSVSQNICVYSQSTNGGYSVIATGSGPGGAFVLSSGAAALAYEVLWSGSSNQSGGTSLIAGTSSGGYASVASQKTCTNGPPHSASLTVVLRSASLEAATAGNYAGSLQLTIVPD